MLEREADEPATAAAASSSIDWSTFWDGEHNDGEWVFPDVLARGRGHAIYAAHKTGKSLLALWMAAKLASCARALRRPLPRLRDERGRPQRPPRGHGLRSGKRPRAPQLRPPADAAAARHRRGRRCAQRRAGPRAERMAGPPPRGHHRHDRPRRQRRGELGRHLPRLLRPHGHRAQAPRLHLAAPRPRRQGVIRKASAAARPRATTSTSSGSWSRPRTASSSSASWRACRGCRRASPSRSASRRSTSCAPRATGPRAPTRLAYWLDKYGVELDATCSAAMKVLREHGVPKRKQLVLAALRFRREHAGGGVVSGSRNRWEPLEPGSGNRPGAAPSSEPESGSGNHPEPLPRATGDAGDPLRGPGSRPKRPQEEGR